jgi:glutamine cyclotransferase
MVTDPKDSKEYIWGNVFMDSSIIKLDPETGVIAKRYDLTLLFEILHKAPQEYIHSKTA